MNKLRKIVDYALHSPDKLLLVVLVRIALIIPDKLYLKWLFRLKMGYWMDFSDPKSFNEKLQWLKLYNRRPEYTQMVDKFAAKEYVAKIIGEEYIIPTLGVWDRFEDIDFDALPNQFVLKTTHGGGGGGVVICKDKSQFDIQAARVKLNKSLKQCIYKNLKEWPYKDVPRRIIAEQYMVDESGVELKDYKFFCFNGAAWCFKVDFDRSTTHRANYYDMQTLALLPFGEECCVPDFDRNIEIPQNIMQMRCLAEKLSNGIPFLRVDWYNVAGKIYFGEMTFYPASGLGAFTSAMWDEKLGDLLELSNRKNA